MKREGSCELDGEGVKRAKSMAGFDVVGEGDMIAWLNLDDDTMTELSKLVKFIHDPYSPTVIFKSSAYVTINGNEESCGSSFSDQESSVMASIDMGGVTGAFEGWARKDNGCAWGPDADEARGWVVEHEDMGLGNFFRFEWTVVIGRAAILTLLMKIPFAPFWKQNQRRHKENPQQSKSFSENSCWIKKTLDLAILATEQNEVLKGNPSAFPHIFFFSYVEEPSFSYKAPAQQETQSQFTLRVAPHTKERVIETRFSEAHVVPSEIAYVTADRFRRPAQPKLRPQSSLWNSLWKLSSSSIREGGADLDIACPKDDFLLDDYLVWEYCVVEILLMLNVVEMLETSRGHGRPTAVVPHVVAAIRWQNSTFRHLRAVAPRATTAELPDVPQSHGA
nr:Protein SON like [Ipomoea batatas]